ncbi:MAG TPA: hypothetical protein VFW62_02675, partial [bacterium]|nr:hypothetical protein [bacterium]
RLVYSRKSLLDRPGPAESLEGQAIQADKINTATLLDSFGVDPEAGSPRIPLKVSLSQSRADDVYLSDHLSAARIEGAIRVFEDLLQEKTAAKKFPRRHLRPKDEARFIPATENDWSVTHLADRGFVFNKATTEVEKDVRFQKGNGESSPYLAIHEAKLKEGSKFRAAQIVNFSEPGLPQTRTYVFSWIGGQAITAIGAQLGLPIQGRENLLKGLAQFIFESGLYTPEEMRGPLQDQSNSEDAILYRIYKAYEQGTEEDSFYRIWHSPSALGILTHEVDQYEKDHVVRIILEHGGIERFEGAMPLGPAWMNFLNPFLRGEWR